MSASNKWWCSQCTYQNYDNAIKCTMCGISKSSTLISDDGFDIYQIAERALTEREGAIADTPVLEDASKWPCPACTYLNYQRATKCTQCHTKKPNSYIDQMESLSLSDPPNLMISIPETNRLSPPSAYQAAALDVHNECSSELSSTSSSKWSCRACTYMNWPRATKCIMCKTHKGSVLQSSPDIFSTPSPFPVIQDSAQCNSPTNEARQITHLECDAINKINQNKTETLPTNRTSPVNTSRRSSPVNSSSPIGASAQREGAMALSNFDSDLIFRNFRRRYREADRSWLNACIGVLEGDSEPVQTYLTSGGDPMRQLTASDIKILARPSAFDEGFTLVHLAIRYGRQDLLANILSRMDVGTEGVKRMPCFVAPDLAQGISRHIASCLRQRKGHLGCHFFTEICTFSLPAEIDDLPTSIQEQLFEEILDKDAQKQLEEVSPIINWNLELTERLGSRLYALWNRTAGDCLLDSILQASWGVFDRDGTLRRALADSLTEAANLFYPRWRDYEQSQAELLDYYISESQMLEEWTELVCLSTQRGAPLEQLHIFALSHILRRPIIVYGVKSVKSFRGEDLGFAKFEGVYLPLLWEHSFCWNSPLCLGYTRGHFSALVPMEPDSVDSLGAGAILDTTDPQIVFLPLMTHDGKMLPVHFLTHGQTSRTEEILRTWLDVCVTEGGILVAQQHLPKPPLSVAQMSQEWLNHYKRVAQMECAPFSRPLSTQGYSSDGDSEEE